MKSFIKKYHIISLFSLLLILILFYFPVLFLGRTLQGPEMARMNLDLKSPPSAETILSSKVTPQIFNTEQATAGYGRYPDDIFLGNLIRAHEWPLWNPYVGAGNTFAAQYETSAFFPLRIIQVLFPPSARDWFFILHIWFAGIFMYLFLNATGTNRISAFFGACLYMGSGVFSWFMQLEEYMNVAMILPLLMLCVHKLSVKNSLRNIAFVAISSALLFYAGQPEAMFYCFVLAACYFLFSIFFTQKNKIVCATYFGSYVLATLLGIMLASPLLLLFMQLFHHGFTIHPTIVKKGLPWAGIKARTPFSLLPAILLPKLLEWPIMPLTIPAAGEFDFIGSYIGFMPVIFLISGFLFKKIPLKKEFIFFLSAAIIMLLIDLGFWPFNLIGYLPLFRMAWSPRWGGATWSFSFITAATYGFYFLQNYSGNDIEWKRLIKTIAIIAGIILYICIAIACTGYYLPNLFIFTIIPFFQPTTQIIISSVFAFASLLLTITILLKYRTHEYAWHACIAIMIISLWYWLPKGDLLSIQFLNLVAPKTNYFLSKIVSLGLFLCFLFGVYLFLKNKIRISLYLIFIIFIANLAFAISVLPGYPRKETPESTTPFIIFLQKESGFNRFFATAGILIPRFASVFHLYDVRSASAISINTYQHFIDDYMSLQKLPDAKQQFLAYAPPTTLGGVLFKNSISAMNDHLNAFNMLSTKYVVTPANENEAWLKTEYPNLSNALTPIYQDTSVNIYLNKEALPRTYIVSDFKTANSYETAQTMSMDSNLDLKKTAVLETQLPANWFDNTVTLNAQASILKYSANKVIIQATTNKKSMLILTDVDYPGWHATVDGKVTKIYRVNGLIRGVIMDAGTHTIEFYYFPTIFKLGLILMIAAAFICLIFLFSSRNGISENENNRL